MKTVEERLHYKDVSPIETVKNIQSILKQNDIEVEEEWKDQDNMIGTYTVRVTIKGTNVGANGKGVNREYARASGYAEFIERIQNDILLSDCVVGEEDGINFILDPDEQLKTAHEIMEENNAFIQHYLKRVKLEDASMEEKENAFKEVHKIDYIRCGNNDRYLTTPFYSLKEQKIVYLPAFAYRSCYGSNGMAAGNTREEALIQGLSEIIERYVQFKVFKDVIAFPNIPEKYLERYPYIKKMYDRLQKIPGYRFILKDCSLGGKYPVAALLGIELNSGRYGFKFGCHPDFGVAMERTFTEATQGRKIFEYTRCSLLDFFNEGAFDSENIANTCKVGSGVYPFQTLSSKPTYQFVQMEDVSELSNKDILKKMLCSILDDGFDVMIRDVSCMGFPSYHIVIPGMSEIKDCSEPIFRVYNTQCYIVKKLLYVNKLTKDDCHYISSVIRYYANSYLENDMRKFFIGVNPEYKFPGEAAYSGALYLAAMCHVFCREYDKAAYFIKCLIKTAECNGANLKSEEMKEYYATKYYLEGMQVMNNHECVMDYLGTFFDEGIVQKIDELFKDSDNILIKLYSNIPRGNCKITKEKQRVKKNIELIRKNNSIDQKLIATVLY